MSNPTPRRRRLIVGSILSVFAGAVIATAVLTNTGNGAPDQSNPLQEPAATAEYATGAAPEVATTEATTAAQLPSTGDISLTTIITSEQCFGSAGCDVDWKMQASTALDMSQWPDTFTITFTVSGIQGGYTGSLDYEGGGQFGGNTTGFGQTAKHVDTLTATVTEISA